jgi:hypothetical protein
MVNGHNWEKPERYDGYDEELYLELFILSAFFEKNGKSLNEEKPDIALELRCLSSFQSSQVHRLDSNRYSILSFS